MSGLMPPVYYDDSPHPLYFTPDGLPPKLLTPEETFEKERRHERETLRLLFSRYSLPLPESIEKEGVNTASPSWDLDRTEQMVTYGRALRESKITGVTSLLTSPYSCVEDVESSPEGPTYRPALPPCSSVKPESLKRSLEESSSNDDFTSPHHSFLAPNFSKLCSPPLSPAYKKQKPIVTYPPDAVPTRLSTDRPTFSSNFEKGNKSTQPTTSSPTAAEIGRDLRKGITNQTMRKGKMKEAFLVRRSANAVAQCEHSGNQTSLSTAEVSAMQSQAEESDHLTAVEDMEKHEAKDKPIADVQLATQHNNIPPSTPNRNEYFRAPYEHVVGFPPERPTEAKQTKIHASMPGLYCGHSSIIGAYVTLEEEDSQDNTVFEPEANMDDEADTPRISASEPGIKRYSDWEVDEISSASSAVETSAQQYEVDSLDEDESQPGPTEEETPAPKNSATYPDAEGSQESAATESPSRKKISPKDHKYEKPGQGVYSARIQKSSSRTQKMMKGHWSMNAVRLRRACSV